MKKHFKFILIFICFFTICSNLPALTIGAAAEEDAELDEKTGFPLILKKPFPVFDYGLTASWVTRIIRKTGRSNFVFEDSLLGVYCNMQTRNMEPLDSMIRLSVYYPYKYRFNGQIQPPVNMLNFAIDLLAAPYVTLSLWHYVTFDLGAGLHFLYQQGDRWHYANLGLGAIARVNMPLARQWSLFLDGIASLDYGNLGNNSKMEHYDICWQYQVAFGFRFSIKSPNRYTYIPSKKPYNEYIDNIGDKVEAKQLKKNQKKAAAEAKKKADKN